MEDHRQSERKLVNLGKLADSPKELQELGRRLVAQAVRNAVEERMGQKNATPMVVRRVAKGETVPPDLLGRPGLTVNSDLEAMSSWGNSWGNLAIWDRTWSESDAVASLPVLGLTDLKARFRLGTILTSEELAVVDKLKIAE